MAMCLLLRFQCVPQSSRAGNTIPEQQCWETELPKRLRGHKGSAFMKGLMSLSQQWVRYHKTGLVITAALTGSLRLWNVLSCPLPSIKEAQKPLTEARAEPSDFPAFPEQRAK